MFGKTLWRAASVGTIRRARPGVARHRIVGGGASRGGSRNNKSSNNSIHSSGYKSSYHRTKRLNLTLSGLAAEEKKKAVALTVDGRRMTKLAGLIPGTLVFRRFATVDWS